MQDSCGAAPVFVRSDNLFTPERRLEPSYAKDGADHSDFPKRKPNRAISATNSTAPPGTATSRTVGEDTYPFQASLEEWPGDVSDTSLQEGDCENLELERMRTSFLLDDCDEDVEMERLRNAFMLDEAPPYEFYLRDDVDDDEDLTEASRPAGRMTWPDYDDIDTDVFRFSRLKVNSLTAFGTESASSAGSSEPGTPRFSPIHTTSPEWPFEERPGEWPLLPAGGAAGAALRMRLRKLTERSDAQQVPM